MHNNGFKTIINQNGGGGPVYSGISGAQYGENVLNKAIHKRQNITANSPNKIIFKDSFSFM